MLCPREEEEEAGSRAVPASVNAGGRGGCALGVTAAWCGPQCEGGGGGAWSTLAPEGNTEGPGTFSHM